MFIHQKCWFFVKRRWKLKKCWTLKITRGSRHAGNLRHAGCSRNARLEMTNEGRGEDNVSHLEQADIMHGTKSRYRHLDIVLREEILYREPPT